MNADTRHVNDQLKDFWSQCADRICDSFLITIRKIFVPTRSPGRDRIRSLSPTGLPKRSLAARALNKVVRHPPQAVLIASGLPSRSFLGAFVKLVSNCRTTYSPAATFGSLVVNVALLICRVPMSPRGARPERIVFIVPSTLNCERHWQSETGFAIVARINQGQPCRGGVSGCLSLFFFPIRPRNMQKSRTPFRNAEKRGLPFAL